MAVRLPKYIWVKFNSLNRFVQCNWGARHLVNAKEGKKNGNHSSSTMEANNNHSNGGGGMANLRYEYDDHYFMSDPVGLDYE
jgi:hypothetical protein